MSRALDAASDMISWLRRARAQLDKSAAANTEVGTTVDRWRKAAELLPTSTLLTVSGDMVDLLHGAEPSMPEDPLRLDRLPWSRCFCLFDQPLVKRVVEGRSLSVVGVLWVSRFPDGEPFQVRFDKDADHPNYEFRPGVRASWFAMIGDKSGWPASPVTQTAWAEGEVPSGPGDSPEDARLHRLLICLWSMVEQRIAVARPGAERAAVRRWERAVPGAKVPETVTVTLRRPASSSRADEPATTGSVDWSHRWLVDGHWHGYWVGPHEDQHLEHRWLTPYVKGPADKPVVVKRKTYAWTR